MSKSTPPNFPQSKHRSHQIGKSVVPLLGASARDRHPRGFGCTAILLGRVKRTRRFSLRLVSRGLTSKNLSQSPSTSNCVRLVLRCERSESLLGLPQHMSYRVMRRRRAMRYLICHDPISHNTIKMGVARGVVAMSLPGFIFCQILLAEWLAFERIRA